MATQKPTTATVLTACKIAVPNQAAATTALKAGVTASAQYKAYMAKLAAKAKRPAAK